VTAQDANVRIIAGPTASGKSALALETASTCNGIIINADSLQIYDALPILTAQPSTADKETVPHRLYALLSPNQVCTAMIWRQMALTEIRAALNAGQTPIIVGGTGFYLKSLLEGLSPIPEVPEEVRILSEDILDRIGISAFYDTLKEKDPETAAKLDPQNRQRLVRAWEVLAHTGKGLSYWHTLPRAEPDPDFVFDITLVMPLRAQLYERCDLRFSQMIENGAVEEARDFDDRMMAGTIPVDTPVAHALGFRPLQEHVRGEMPLETSIMLAQAETRHYAKRQSTWFKHQIKNQKNIAQVRTLE
jgi:tRNA dimethylallyltransferase